MEVSLCVERGVKRLEMAKNASKTYLGDKILFIINISKVLII